MKVQQSPETAQQTLPLTPAARSWGVTVACGEHRCEACPGRRTIGGEVVGVCTHRCHEKPTTDRRP